VIGCLLGIDNLFGGVADADGGFLWAAEPKSAICRYWV
jgi:hypothetical protein